MNRPETELIRLPKKADAQEVVYALKLRGISSEATHNGHLTRTNRFAITVRPEDLPAAKEALGLILDVMLPMRADDGQGGCFFCGYNLTGTSGYSTICPECGKDLHSIESRFAARTGPDGSR